MNTTDVLERATNKILPSKEGLAALMDKGPITLYLGIDPSNPKITLGHTVVLRKLRQFQDLGHKVILLIGDFTGMIGDPTDKGATRVKLTLEEVLENAKNYQSQVSKILAFEGPNKAVIRFNSEWLSKLNITQLLDLASLLTVQQLEERDMFIKRKKEGKPIYLHEFLYPVMQGYDSVALEVDLEVGGTDQTFNMLIGRQLLKQLKNKEKYVLTVPLLVGTDGAKMGKSLGNFIAIEDEPRELFGKIMSLKDGLIKDYFELCTDVAISDIDTILTRGPLEAKKALAQEIVKMYHGASAADQALTHFGQTFGEKSLDVAASVSSFASNATLATIVREAGLVSSNSELRRLAEQGAIEVNNQVEKDFNFQPLKDLTTSEEVLIRVGKHRFVKVKTND